MHKMQSKRRTFLKAADTAPVAAAQAPMGVAPPAPMLARALWRLG